MHLLRDLTLVLLINVIIAPISNTVCAQKAELAVNAWKKEVARVIVLKENSKQAKTDNKGNLLKMMVDEIKAGKLTAFANTDNEFTTKLTAQKITEMTSAKRDTVTVLDPVTGAERTKVRVQDFDINSIVNYRLLEEWSFDPTSGKTQIRIAGIAPVRDIYGDDGIFRGVQAMFWLRYADAVGLIKKYDELHQDNALFPHLWKDYFSNEPASKNYSATLLRVIDLPESEDALKHPLKDVSSDNTLAELLETTARTGKAQIYGVGDYNFHKPMSYQQYEATGQLRGDDTITVIDPVNGHEREVIRHVEFSLRGIHKFGIVEQWSLDITSGKTDVQVLGLAALNNDSKPGEERAILLLKYADIRHTIAQYDQYHPTNNLWTHIWDDYFLSYLRPTAVK